MALVQLYESNQHQWEFTGICGFVSVEKNKFGYSSIHIRDEKTNSLCFELEIYEGFTLSQPLAFFQTFEGVNSVFGLSYADEVESFQFATTLRAAVIRIDKQKIPEEKFAVNVSSSIPPLHFESSQTQKPKSRRFKKLTNFIKRKDKKEAEMVIGNPTNFTKHAHIGWDEKLGFSIENIPPEWKKLFVTSNISKKALQNESVRQSIISIYEEVKQECSPFVEPELSDDIPAPPPLPVDGCFVSTSYKDTVVSVKREKTQPKVDVPDLNEVVAAVMKEKFKNAQFYNDFEDESSGWSSDEEDY